MRKGKGDRERLEVKILEIFLHKLINLYEVNPLAWWECVIALVGGVLAGLGIGRLLILFILGK